jgi:hypothetical protein
MKKLLVVLVILISVNGYSQLTIGGSYGFQTHISKSTKIGNSGGMWIDFGKFGLEYQTSGSVNLDFNEMDKFVKGKSSTYEAGNVVKNYGFFINDNQSPVNKNITFFAGGGLQHTKTVSAISSSYVPVIKDGYLPYAVLGLKYKLEGSLISRVELLMSEVSSINFGLGITIK